MQEFVVGISHYARNLKPSFIIIPQNGEALAFNNADPDEGLNDGFLSSIDGIGVEEIFYNGDLATDDYRLSMLRQIKATKKIMVSEFVSNSSNVQDGYDRNYGEGFIAFVRDINNYDYQYIPSVIQNESTLNVTNLSLAKNYLYLISNQMFSSKQEMISAIAETNFDAVIIDLFFEDSEFTKDDLNQIRKKKNGGQRLLLSYVSIGSAEKYRYYYKKGWGHHHPLWLKKKYDGYPDEFWVKFWKDDWQSIIYGNDESYIKKIVDAGFDGAYLDNVEAYYFLYYKN